MLRVALGVVAFIVCAAPIHGGARPQDNPARLVAVGDIHGSIEGLTTILQAAGLIDANGRWSGGTATFVQTGDFTDRGAHVRDVMDLLMRLEDEAARAGGRVEVLLGNHEGMNVLRDLRDVSQEAYAAFADRRSEDRRRRAFEAHNAIAKRAGNPLSRDEWMVAHPPGYVEYINELGPSGRYGRWIRNRKLAIEIDGTIFMHAGLPPETTDSISAINERVKREMESWDALVAALERQRLIAPAFTLQEVVDAAQVEIGRIAVALKTGEPLGDHVTRDYVDRLQQLRTINQWTLIASGGPLWYRGLANLPEDALPGIEALLSRCKASRFVVGHTPQLPGRITPRFGGRVILIDTGMLNSVYRGGRPSALELRGGEVVAIYSTSQERITGGKE